MTESEWLEGTNLKLMLELVGERASLRKIRLFAIACCRRISHLITDSASQTAIMVSERFADNLASEKELLKAASATDPEILGGDAHDLAACACAYAVLPHAVRWNAVAAIEDAVFAAAFAAEATFYQSSMPIDCVTDRVDEARLIREIFGNPFRPVTVDPAWLQWRDGTVPKIAQVIYDERRFGELPILADALEEAGCTHADILNHCRGLGDPGEHVRGCWVVDLLLGKQ